MLTALAFRFDTGAIAAFAKLIALAVVFTVVFIAVFAITPMIVAAVVAFVPVAIAALWAGCCTVAVCAMQFVGCVALVVTPVAVMKVL